MDIPYDTQALWCKQIERRLYELSALIKGQIPTQADRVSDICDQIDIIRKDLEAVSTKLDKVADYVKANVPKKNGGAS